MAIGGVAIQVGQAGTFFGQYRIRFETRDENQDLYGIKRARLLEIKSGRVLREVWSDAAGAGVFNGIALIAHGYTVIVCNNQRSNGTLDYPDIADFVTPEAMP